MKSPRKPAARWPWDPVELELHEISAVKSMAAQHPAAFEVICVKLCRERQLSFTVGLGEDGIRATDYAEGKRAVAEQLRALVAMKMPGPPIPKDEGPHAVPKGEPPKD